MTGASIHREDRMIRMPMNAINTYARVPCVSGAERPFIVHVYSCFACIGVEQPFNYSVRSCPMHTRCSTTFRILLVKVTIILCERAVHPLTGTIYTYKMVIIPFHQHSNICIVVNQFHPVTKLLGLPGPIKPDLQSVQSKLVH
jgi:uncharacterized protein YqhQ